MARTSCMMLLVVATLALAIATAVAHPYGQSSDTCSNVVENERFDCYPEDGANEQACLARGCCWTPSGDRPVPNVPFCHFPETYAFGYKEAWRTEGPDRTIVNMIRRGPSGLPNDVNEVMVDISSIDESKVRVKVFDPTRKRFEVSLPPLNLVTKYEQGKRQYKINLSQDLRLKIFRRSTGTVVFDTDLSKLVFSDQYIQLSNRVPAKYLYGIGEHRDVFRKEVTWKKYTILNNDRPPAKDAPLYGTHPFYLMVEDDKANSHGVLFFNNNPMDIVLQPTPAVTYKTIGGIIDFFVYLGPSPSDVVRQHIELVGKPDLPPYWGLGFQLSKYGYNSLNETKKALMRNIEAGVPIDVQWNDIDSLDKHNDFTYDKKTFAGLPEFVKLLHSMGMRYVPIVDIAISGSEPNGTYPPFDDGLAMDIFIKNTTNQLFIGKVWNDVSSVFPDFTHPSAGTWWAKQLKAYFEEIPIDGAWIDMNEPSNFVNGQYDPRTGQGYGCPADTLESPPFVPGAPEPLQRKTLCMSAKQYIAPHYDLHNMQAIYEAKATKEALTAITGKRQFIISRASSTGQGVYGMHWSGDIWSDWDSFKWTIPSIMEFNMFGMPLIGADICGFVGATTQELCARWQALGAFYPFSRNHNTIDVPEQDPAFLGGDVLSATKYALSIRYSILPYMYTLFYRASAFADTVARPLFFEFPNDTTSYEIETQFMLGPAVMVVPVLEQGQTKVQAYFPKGLWYNDETLLVDSKGEYLELNIPLDRIVIARRGGHVVPNLPPKPTTSLQRLEPFEFSVYLDENKTAAGQLYWDDGESLSTLLLRAYSLVDINVKDNVFTTNLRADGFRGDFSASAVYVYGLTTSPSSVLVNGQSTTSFSFEAGKLSVKSLTINLNEKNTISWSFTTEQKFTKV